MTLTDRQPQSDPLPILSDKGLAALTRAFAHAARDLQRCTALDSDPMLNKALASIGTAMGADRAYVFEIVDTVFICNTHEWCAAGIPAVKDTLQRVPYTTGDYFWERFRSFGSMQLGDVSALMPHSDLRQVLEAQDITALIAAPFWRGAEIAGFVGLDFIRGKRRFVAEEDNLMRGFAAQVGLLRGLAHAERGLLRLGNDLARAQSLVSATVSALPKLLVETDRQGVIVGYHQSTPLIFAATPQEVIGQMPESVLPPHLAAICRKAMQEVDRLGWSQSHEYSLETPRGTKWFTLSASPRGLNSRAQDDGYLFVVRDVTDAQLQNRQMRQLVRVAEQSTNLIFLTDSNCEISWMNPAAVLRTGYPLDDAKGMHPSDVLQMSETSPELVDELRRTLDQGHAIQREVRAQTRDGAPYWLDLNVQPLHDSAGKVEGYMVLGTNTTAHKQAEARLLHDRCHAMSASHEGIAIIRPNGRLSYANPALRTFLGIADDARLDALMWTDVTPADLTARMTRILPVLLSDGVWEGEFAQPADDGTVHHFAISLSVQDDTSTLAILRNITRRKQAEQDQAKLREQVQRAQSRQLGAQLAAGMAHDFANLLTTISGSADVLARQTGQEAADSIARIRAATDEARALARRLTRLETARPAAETLALAPVLQQAVDLIQPGIEAPMRIVLDLPADSLQVHGDRMELMQLVLNLLLNARDACQASLARSPDGPSVLRLAARPCPQNALPHAPDLGAVLPQIDYALIEIEDCGDGIDPDLRETLFMPYHSTKGDAGAGLGLAVVADIIKTRGAALQFAENSPKGTRVQVFWPCTPIAALAVAETPTPLADTNILLIDNDDTVLQMLSDILVSAGAEVASCADPTDAIDAVTQSPSDWDLVLTDYDMGAINGTDLARIMHDQREDLPIVLMTGNTELHFATKSVLTEFVATLRKPICPIVLVSIMLAAKLRSQRQM